MPYQRFPLHHSSPSNGFCPITSAIFMARSSLFKSILWLLLHHLCRMNDTFCIIQIHLVASFYRLCYTIGSLPLFSQHCGLFFITYAILMAPSPRSKPTFMLLPRHLCHVRGSFPIVRSNLCGFFPPFQPIRAPWLELMEHTNPTFTTCMKIFGMIIPGP